MPYFTLDYFISKNDISGFFIKESPPSITPEQLLSLTSLVKHIIQKQCPCISVPSSFPLNPNTHRNIIVLLQDVLYPLTKKISTSSDAATIQKSIELLTSSINKELLSADPQLFQQPLPQIINSLTTTTFAKKRSSSSLERSTENKKQRIEESSFTETNSSLNKQTIPLKEASEEASLLLHEDEGTDLWILNALNNSPKEILKLTVDEIEQFTSDASCSEPTHESAYVELSPATPSYLLPVIEVLENNQYFIIKTQSITNIPLYLEHLHNGIMYALESDLLFIDPSAHSFLIKSHSHLYHNTLNQLLSLIKTQTTLFSSITDDNTKRILLSEHEHLKYEIIAKLQNSGFTDTAIETITLQSVPNFEKKETYQDPAYPLDNTNSSSSQSSSEKEKSLPEIKSANDYFHKQSSQSKPTFIHLKINRYYRGEVFFNTKPQRLHIFLKQIQKLVQTGVSLFCRNDIEGLPQKTYDNRVALLKALYLIFVKNITTHYKYKQIPNISKAHIQKILLDINETFCRESGETINPATPSTSLTENIDPKTIVIPKPIQGIELTHYHISLRNIQYNQRITYQLCIKKLSCSSLIIFDILKLKNKNISSTLSYLRSLSEQHSVLLEKDNILKIESQKEVPLAELALPLLSLLKNNQLNFKKMFSPNHGHSVVYKRMQKNLDECLRIVSKFNTEINMNDALSIQSTNPYDDIIHLTNIPTEDPVFIMPLFSVKQKLDVIGTYFHLFYTTRKNQLLKKLWISSSFDLQLLRKEINNLLSDNPSLPIYYTPYQGKRQLIQDQHTLVNILYQGCKENELYWNKYHPKALTHHFSHNPSSDLKTTLDAIIKKYSSIKAIPSIKEPLTLETSFNHIKNILNKSVKKVKTDFQLQSNKIFLFSVRKTHSTFTHEFQSYKIAYVNRAIPSEKSSLISAIRGTMHCSIQNMRYLSNADLSPLRIRTTDPFTHVDTEITEPTKLYKILYEGIIENLTFIKSKYSRVLEKYLHHSIEEDYQTILAYLATHLKDEILKIKAPHIITRMIKESSHTSIPDDPSSNDK
ncbi:hypothetical protein CLAVI_000931 [Candidatus Clavichlamydia salmonicola]|uniref:hypothetical protein n=1 Tax=Candidatus Clavichlamydia salmonicola TaxID=469812 RepID=UPI00189191DB|nr:hypothetical protein [Candidatus Clavichlamydia salmonicola]MBF5051290.1 hypothetical protein [Candidatus Clavichlamydia salmonicola]